MGKVVHKFLAGVALMLLSHHKFHDSEVLSATLPVIGAAPTDLSTVYVMLKRSLWQWLTNLY